MLNNTDEIQFNSTVDSFVSEHYVGNQNDLISNITGAKRNFLLQIENPNSKVWYRIYINSEWKFPSNEDLQKNGVAFLVKKFDVNPSTMPEENIHTDIKIKPVILNKEMSLPSIYDIPDIGEETTEKFHKNYEKFSSLMDSMVPRRLEAPFVTSFGGYPQWQQTNEIPEGFTLDNFVFQVMLEGQEDRLELNDFGDGGLYVFDNGKDIGLVYQR